MEQGGEVIPEKTARKTVWLMFGAAIIYVLLTALSIAPAIISSSASLAENAIEYYMHNSHEVIDHLIERNNPMLPPIWAEIVSSSLAGESIGESLDDMHLLQWFQLLEAEPELLFLLPTVVIINSLNLSSIFILVPLTIAFYWFVFRRERKRVFDVAPIEIKAETPLFIFTAWLSLNLAISSMVNLLWHDAYLQTSFEAFFAEFLDLKPFTLLAAGVLLVLVNAPLTEEFFFRGVIFTRLRSLMSLRGAMVASAVIFGLFHGININALAAGFSGYLMAELFYRSGRIELAVFAHAAYNLFPTLQIVFGGTSYVSRFYPILLPLSLIGVVFSLKKLNALLPTYDPTQRAAPYRSSSEAEIGDEDEGDETAYADPSMLLGS